MEKALAKMLLVTLMVLSFGSAARAANSIVRFDTSLGSFEVELYDDEAPITVENFLAYVTGDLYENSFIHRSAPGFVIQGGGFTYDEPQVYTSDFPVIPTFPPIINEFSATRSNLRGTIAMAKTSDPDSATCQFFFNLVDNSTSLDNPANSGGFTVFGEVKGDGMDVVDAIAAVEIYNFDDDGSGIFGSLPVRNYSEEEWNAFVEVTDDNMVLVDIWIPEPATMSLLALGGLAIFKRRRK